MVKRNPISLQIIQVARKGVTVLKKGKRLCSTVYACYSPDDPELTAPPASQDSPMTATPSCPDTDRAEQPEPVYTASGDSGINSDNTKSSDNILVNTPPDSGVRSDAAIRYQEEMAENPWRDKKIKIGGGDFINQLPLNFKLEETAEEFGVPIEFVRDKAQTIAEKMYAGDFDAAMVSLVDYFQNPEFPISSDSCIASEGVMRGILMYGRVQPVQIKTIAAERTAKTGAIMAQILLAEQFGAIPEIKWLVHADNWEAVNYDAVILTDERALRQPSRGENFSFVWDMGQRWTQWTGVPFVYNLWVARDKDLAKLLAPVLSQARDKGQSIVREIAIGEALRLKIDPEFCLDYLTHKLTMRLAGRQRKGIEIFCRLAKKHGLIDIGAAIPFNNHLRFHPTHEKSDSAASGNGLEKKE